MKFTKFHALGNDFLIVDQDEVALFEEPGALAHRLCERHTGVGADGILLVAVKDRARGEANFRIFNADGSEAEISGNGLRCAAAYLYSQQKIDAPLVRFHTAAGERVCELVRRTEDGFLMKIDLGVPRFASADIPFDDGAVHDRIVDYPLMINAKTYPVTVVSIGNPHCDVFIDRFPGRFEWHELGREIESHPFFPRRTNIEFIRVRGRNEIEVLFWERGVGETLSSGSGAAAAAVAAMIKGLVDRTVTIKTEMGSLLVEWPSDTARVSQTGPAEFAFVGSFLFK
ncbi:MAG: diaminopimelate epimerase [Candidatus Aminicenantes bacterium]|nr:diaminopimelate epimerase [Candidatus Aminicenantes bacterium]